MTVAPASTRANRINSDSLDWSYIGISVTVWHSTSARPARRDPRLIHAGRDGQRFHCSLRSPDLGPAAGLLKTKARIARKHGSWIAVPNAADEVRPNPGA